MLSLLIVHISSVPAHETPTELTSWQTDFIADVNRWNALISSLLHWIERQILHPLFQGLLGRVLSLSCSTIFTFFLSGDLVTLFGLDLSLDRLGSGLVETHVVNHVLDQAVDILIGLVEGDLE